MKQVILLPDLHAPYHDKKAWSLALKAIKKAKPDILVILGDFADFYAASTFDKDPRRKADLEWEVDVVNECLDQAEALGVPKVVFCEGNHCFRLERYLTRKAPELFNLVSVRKLFKIHKRRGWVWVPYKQYYKIGKLHVTHDFNRHGKYCAQQTLDAFQHNIAFGHSHRASICYSGNLAGDKHVSASLGWLGDPEQVDYMYAGSLREWTQGIGQAWIENNGNVHLHFLPILDGKIILPSKPEMIK